MRINTNPGDKADKLYLNVKSDEASATISKGAPVCLTIDGTDDGLAVILPSVALKAHAFAFGVAMSDIAPGQYGDAQVFGFCQRILHLGQTRAASTDDWSASTHSSGVMLNIDTVNKVFSTSGGTLAKTAFLPFAVLCESTVLASSASATTDTRTINTIAIKAFLRML